MPKASVIQNSFNAGEFSPLMFGRTDFKKYESGMQTCQNMVPTTQGPIMRRPGFRYVKNSKYSDKFARLLPFEFSVEQAYIIEAGDLYFRFFKDDGAIVETGKVITAATQASPVVITAVGHGYTTGDEDFISGVVGMTEINGRFFTITVIDPNSYSLDGVDGTGYTAYASGGTSALVYEIASPYLEAEIPDIQFAQSADVLYISHPNHEPRKLTRTGHTAWTLTVIDFQDGPYLSINATTTTILPSGTTGAITLTASAVTGINDDQGFLATDVGRVIRVFNISTTKWAWAEITSLTSTTIVGALVKSDAIMPVIATVEWRLGAWSDTTSYPSSVTFFENRLFFAGATTEPQRIDGSQSDDYEVFSPTNEGGTVVATNAVSFTLVSNDVNAVKWMIDVDKGLAVGTARGEWIVRPSTLSEALSPTNVQAKRSTTYGSEDTLPVRVANTVLFVQRVARKVRGLSYIFEIDGFRAPDLTLLAEHLTLGGIDYMAYQQEPFPVVWAVRSDGQLLAFSYSVDEDVSAWTPHPVGGSSDSNGTAAKVETIAVIPAPDNTRDELWTITQRYIDGAVIRQIEFSTKFWEEGDLLEDAYFVDAGLTYDGAATTTITGLYHLEGEAVRIVADGANHPDKVVADGTIALNLEASKVSVGLGNDVLGATLRSNAGAADGTAQGKTVRVTRCTFRLWETLGFQYSADGIEYFDVLFREGSDNMDAPPPIFTGDHKETWPAGYDNEGVIHFRKQDALPCTLVALMPQLHTQDDG